ncbi:MAG: hypothetical protein K0B81_03420 [Candidatus Cloacimonetes bacterium]|nr:hypothetical protein [Candidatus Cloacimonadota bacterium]
MKVNVRLSFLFTGLAYVLVGVLVLTYQEFLYYWIAGLFLIQGLVSIIRAIFKAKN